MCWLYSVPNLLIIQQLKTLYLGENYIKVVCVCECEDLIKCVQSKSISQLELATDSRVVTHQKCHTCGACRKLKGHDNRIITGQKVQFGLSISWQLELVTHHNRESLAKAPCFAEK